MEGGDNKKCGRFGFIDFLRVYEAGRSRTLWGLAHMNAEGGWGWVGGGRGGGESFRHLRVFRAYEVRF